jgi:DNA-binding beta-propeller fold protein YncE
MSGGQAASGRVAVLAILIVLAAGCTGKPAAPAGTGAPGKSTAPAGSGAPSGVAASVAASEYRTAAAVRGYGTVTRTLPPCTTAVQDAPGLPASDTAMTTAQAAPFGVSLPPGGRLALVAAGQSVDTFRIGPSGPPTFVNSVTVPALGLGTALGPDGRYLLVADESDGAEVLSVRAAEQAEPGAVLGDLSFRSDRGQGAIEAAVTPDGRYAFVSVEDGQAIAVYNLQRALARGFGAADYVGSIPAQLAPVGLAVSPDGRWLYSTSEDEHSGTNMGSLSVISVAKAETDPARSVVARVPAGCNPVRVVTSADGSVVWVTARASDALLAFSASALRTDPGHALLADVRVGELPVGLALLRGGGLVVAGDSDRFNVPGAHASLAVVDVPDALAGRPALLGYLPAGQFPRDMAATSDGNLLVVSDYGSDQVETVNLARLP